MAKKETPATTQAEYEKAWEEVKSGKQKAPSFNDMEPLPKPKGYSREKVSSNKPEPTFKSDVDNMVSGVKKFNDKVNDTTKPVRKILEKAAGKEEQGIIGQFTKPNEYSKDNKAKGIELKPYKKGGSVSSASKRADGCATKGKTKGRFV